ncbi:MAG: EAL domain-containing protein [Acidimicrobiia bacterium]|nr:EAL domain-containing protein [Acidimicrobiia bacterium]
MNLATNKPTRKKRSGPEQVWILTITIALAAAAMASQVMDLERLVPDKQAIPWYVLMPLVYIAELTVVHLRFHRHAHSFSMSEVTLVLGLFASAPWELIVAQIGFALALIVNRRQPTMKLAFNLAQTTFVIVLAVVVFRSIAQLGDSLGLAGWFAAIIATQVTVVLANLLINGAIHLSGGTIDRREQLEVLSLTALAGLMNTALALVGITIFWSGGSNAAWLAMVPPVVLFFAYRAYISQRLERSRLESLYQATRVLHESPQIESALESAALYAQDMFEAEVVEIILLPEEGKSAYLTAVGPDDRRVVMEPFELGSEESHFHSIADSGGAMLIKDPTAFVRDGWQMEDGVGAPLSGDHGTFGVIIVANRLNDVSQFEESDVRLLETFASQVSVSLENGRLEDSLAQLTDLKEELRHQALHDSLTKLANRTLFSERVETALDRCARDDRFIAVMFLDLDDFKTVNDSLGHAAGDDLLVQVANRLRSFTRPEDVVARLGGDEFAILLEDLATPTGATDVAERIMAGMMIPFNLEGKELKVHTSIGIAFGGSSDRPDQIMRNADAAMYAAKQTRKGTYRVFEDAMHAEMIRRLELKADLTEAVARDELVLRYQPIVDLATGTVTGVEALVRWQHPTRGIVPPAQFIPFAEESGLIVAIGAFVLEQAVIKAVDWQNARPDQFLTMAVNLSPRQLAEVDMAALIRDTITKHGLEPRRLIIEITENVVMQTTVSLLDDIRDLGVRLAIDDFGTGYSSLAYLDRLPIDIIKIDKSFTDRLNPDEESPLVRTVLQLGDALGIDTVVEGIETAHQLRRLQQLGCAKGQGYLLSPPLSGDDVEELLGDNLTGGMMMHGPTHLRIVG